MKKNHYSRRNFIKTLASGTAAIPVMSTIPGLKTNASEFTLQNKSRIVLVKHPKVIDNEGLVQQTLVNEMINRAILTLSDQKTVIDAWGQYFSKDEKISLKINTLGLDNLMGTSYIQHFNSVSTAIIKGLQTLSIEDRDLFIWDRSDEEITNAGYSISRQEGTLRIMGTRKQRRGEPEGFDQHSYPVGSLSTRVHQFITEQCHSFINIPVLKTHRIAGITGSLKNHYGSINNPREFHQNNATNPGIPEINAIPVIRNKQKLIIADALLGVYEGGPRWNQEMIWPFGGIIAGTDPVAMDTVLLSIINQKRLEEELEPIESAIHLPLSEKLGLGNHQLENIDLIEINLA
ncbi:MAG: DUF362 domain-containing protein [Bacteroidetes bacterium]|nr:DUF362 domain-containing protein [Bacteroidota bacterium]